MQRHTMSFDAAVRRSEPALVREGRFSDYDRIAALRLRHGMSGRSREAWTELWKSNPAYIGCEDEVPIGWVVETSDSEIVGWLANIPFAYCFKGRMLKVAAAGEWVVDPAYRGYSLRLMALSTNQPHADVVLTTTASATAEAACRVLGWSRVPVGRWNESAFWVTNYRGFANVALRTRSVPWAAAWSYPAGAVLRGRDLLRGAGVRRTPSLTVELCEQFDSLFDDFWDELKRQSDGVLVGVRSRDTLNWHFKHALCDNSALLVTALHGSKLMAYAVFDRRDNSRLGLQRYRLIDIQWLRPATDAPQQILSFMLERCRQEHVHVLEDFGCTLESRGAVGIQAPYKRKLQSWGYFTKTRHADLAQELSVRENWQPSLFDGDASL